MIGIIGGTLILDFNLPGEEKTFKNEYGEALLTVGKRVVSLQRHGGIKHIPPHRINHQANILALKEAGVKKIVALYSVGSLKKEPKPGSIVISSDFISFWDIPTITNEHVAPRLADGEELKQAAAKEGIKLKEGIYIQTSGPRLETKAEVKMLAAFGDVVGMTLGSEATLACELGIPFLALCSVDNYAHGIEDEQPSGEGIKKESAKNRENILKILKRADIL
jgi:5'-methylthioadenosine phosphorylase